ncbi:MAG: hypothetical protein QOE58_2183, partial [Actinomycetota bacterium]|nr:hypothetical protein [Actinomycetota bacterium]
MRHGSPSGLRLRRASQLGLAVALLALPGAPVTGQSASSSPYKLPYDHAETVQVTQGVRQGDHIAPWSEWALDFAKMGAEFPVLASRSGAVLGARGDSTKQCESATCWTEANYVVVDHGDGTSALYLHLKFGSVAVQSGQSVRQGESLGTANHTGWSTGPHLHLQVEATPCADGTTSARDACRRRAGWWFTQSKTVSFSDKDIVAKTRDGIPIVNKFYVSDNGSAASTPGPRPTPPTPVPVPTPTPPTTAPSPEQIAQQFWDATVAGNLRQATQFGTSDAYDLLRDNLNIPGARSYQFQACNPIEPGSTYRGILYTRGAYLC